jgi:hypothetical protein
VGGHDLVRFLAGERLRLGPSDRDKGPEEHRPHRVPENVGLLEVRQRLLERLGEPPHAQLGELLLRQRGGVDRDLGGELEAAFDAGEPRRDHRPDHQVGVRALVEALHLGVGRGRTGAHHARHEANRGLPVLPPPAGVRAGPVGGDQPEVARHARGADRDERGQFGEDAGRERLAGLGHPVRALAAREQVHPVAPEAEVDMTPVADVAGDHDGGERRAHAVARGDRTDRLADQHRRVGGSHRIGRRHRDLQLPHGVLGVELVHADPFVLERDDEVARVVRDRREHGKPVGGTAVDRAVDVGVRVRLEPFELERHP